jgi:hypothetical protein
MMYPDGGVTMTAPNPERKAGTMKYRFKTRKALRSPRWLLIGFL